MKHHSKHLQTDGVVTTCNNQNNFVSALKNLQTKQSFSQVCTYVYCADPQSLEADIALALFQEMHHMQIRRSEISYNALISACEKCSTFHQAVGLLEDMQLKRLRSDAITYNALISSCSRLSRVGTALSLFSNMTKTLIQPTSVTCSTLINCCGSKRVATALRLFDHFQQIHVEANLISYNAVISACGNAGLWKQALRIFAEISESNIEPDVFTYNSLIAASCKAYAVQKAWNFQRKMAGVNGSIADIITYISFLGFEDALRCEGCCVSHLCETVQSKAMRFFQQHGG